jgi:Spy/CpxP family protein refolding chaperone
MKYLLLTAALVAGLAGGAATIFYRTAADRELKVAVQNRDSLAWLRVEFNLTEEQFEKIRVLHEEYSRICDEHCRLIQQAARQRHELRTDPNPDPEAVAAAEARFEALRRDCEMAIAAHVQRCAQIMSPREGQRYLAMVLPRIPNFDHEAAPGLNVSGHRH